MDGQWGIVYFAGMKFIYCGRAFDDEKAAQLYAIAELPIGGCPIIVERWRVKALLMALNGSKEELENLAEIKDMQPDTVRRVEEVCGTKTSYWK